MSAFIVGVYLFVLGGAVLALMLWDHQRRKVDLVSIRNIALLGFVVFQVTSAAIRLAADRYEMFRMSDPASAGVEFAAMCTVFLPILLLSYRFAPGVRRPAHWMAGRKPLVGEKYMIGAALLLILLTLVFRFGVLIPYVAIVTNAVAVGFSAVSSGLVGWVWSKKLYSIPLILLVFVVLVANTALVMWGEFGRRNLVGVAGGLFWGLYYGRWRYLRMSGLFVRLAVVGAAPLFFIALYTSVRGAGDGARTTVGHLQAMQEGDFREGLLLLLDGQNTGTAALWCIENYPENFEYNHLLTVSYFFMIPVPRAIWPGKPEPLSTKLASYANVRGVNQDVVLLPAGIIGNAAAEGGWYALLIYAFISGVFLRFFDEIVRANPLSPFAVLPVGCQLGQVLGLARGETSAFANIYVMSFVGVWITMAIAAWLLDSMGLSRTATVGALEAPPDSEDCSDYGDDAWRSAHLPDDHAA